MDHGDARFGTPFIVAGEQTGPRQPGEGAFHDPSQRDDLKALRLLLKAVALCLALTVERQLDTPTSHTTELGRERPGTGSVSPDEFKAWQGGGTATRPSQRPRGTARCSETIATLAMIDLILPSHCAPDP